MYFSSWTTVAVADHWIYYSGGGAILKTMKNCENIFNSKSPLIIPQQKRKIDNRLDPVSVHDPVNDLPLTLKIRELYDKLQYNIYNIFLINII